MNYPDDLLSITLFVWCLASWITDEGKIIERNLHYLQWLVALLMNGRPELIDLVEWILEAEEALKSENLLKRFHLKSQTTVGPDIIFI